MKFCHLHVHSMYSLKDALGSPSEIAHRAKELGYDSIALTDHGNLYGAVEFYEACKREGIKPIIGVEVNVAPRMMSDKVAHIDDKCHHLTLLAETDEGYRNLIKIVTASWMEGFYYVPRVDKEALRKYSRGIIALSGCAKGDIPSALK